MSSSRWGAALSVTAHQWRDATRPQTDTAITVGIRALPLNEPLDFTKDRIVRDDLQSRHDAGRDADVAWGLWVFLAANVLLGACVLVSRRQVDR